MTGALYAERPPKDYYLIYPNGWAVGPMTLAEAKDAQKYGEGGVIVKKVPGLDLLEPEVKARIMEDVALLHAAGIGRVKAISVIENKHGLSLKDAKDLVDSYKS
jgi:ribosomal protein L7/L12